MRNIIRSTTRATPRLLSARWPLTSTLKNQGTCCYHACQPSNRTSEHEKAALLASCDQSRTAEDRNTFVGNLPPLNGSDGIFDVEHVRRTYEVPADFEYPEIPDSISDNPKSVVYNASRRTFTANSGFVESGKKDVFRCHVQVDSAEEEQILGVGEGRQKVRILIATIKM